MNIFRRQPKPAAPAARRPSAYVTPQRRDVAADAAALHPAQVSVIDWQQEIEREARQSPVVSRSPSYVPAASEIVMPRVNLVSPDASLTADITPPAVVESKTFGGHQDRARAWLKYAMPLSLTTAAVATIAAVAFERVPLLSFWSLLIFGLAFMATYAILLLRYWRHTPEGVALENVGQLWDYYRREQAHRHAIERQAWADQRTITIRREDRRK